MSSNYVVMCNGFAQVAEAKRYKLDDHGENAFLLVATKDL